MGKSTISMAILQFAMWCLPEGKDCGTKSMANVNQVGQKVPTGPSIWGQKIIPRNIKRREGDRDPDMP